MQALLNNINEEVKPDDIDLTSFKIQPEINKDIWLDENTLKPEVRKQLLKIADNFMESLDIPWVDYTDVLFTGSLANYNWSKFSDIDLHVLLNKSEITENKELADEYLTAKKHNWNDKHDITIYGFDVECYAQDINEKHTSSGVYSVENSKWLVKPSKENPKLDKEMIKSKASAIMSSIDKIVSLNSKGKHEEVISNYEKLWEAIKKMRQAGLDRSGEYSYENIVFKVLRRTNYLDKLSDIKVDSFDKLNSIK